MTSTAAALRGTRRRLGPLRSIIARRMVESLRVGAQLTTVVEADVTALAAFRARVADEVYDRTGTKLGLFPFLAKAAVDALVHHPVVHASLDEEGTTATYHDAEHLAIAVDTPRGLLAPVIRDAGALGVVELASAIAEVAGKARANTLKPEELGGGTFTVSNTGSRGALFDTPIINQPQVAILGIGAAVDRPAAARDAAGGRPRIEIRTMLYLALSYDHRLVDGADAARYLADVKRRVEHPAFDVDCNPSPPSAGTAEVRTVGR